MIEFAVACGDSESDERLRAIADAYGFDLLEQLPDDPDTFILQFVDDALEIRLTDMKPGTGASVDFTKIDVRTGPGNLSRNQPLGRAMGRNTKTVIDATAGYGHDAFLLACMGMTVTAIEQQSTIFALLEDGLRRAHLSPPLEEAMGGRLTILHADAQACFQTLAMKPDAVYLDPMYPPRKNSSALPKKGIQMLQMMVEYSENTNAALAEAATKVARSRIVVKRPHHAPHLLGEPDHQVTSKLVRYDVYFTHG